MDGWLLAERPSNSHEQVELPRMERSPAKGLLDEMVFLDWMSGDDGTRTCCQMGQPKPGPND